MQKGIKNEYAFANYFDNKKIKDLNFQSQELILTLYGKDIDKNQKIECWRSKYIEKADIKIRIKGIIKGISIKTGHQCSMHQENKATFYQFLTKIGVSDDIIYKFDNFMTGRSNNTRLNGRDYMNSHSKDINEIIEAFNQYYVKTNLIIRFLFLGNDDQKYGCDAIIYGYPHNFLWATKDEILFYLANNPSKLVGCIYVSQLNIKCYDRNLKNNISRIKNQDDIQVKWYTLIEDIEKITTKRQVLLNSHNQNF